MEKHNKFKIDFLDRKDFDFKGIGLTSCLIINEALKRGIKAKVHLKKYVELEYKGEKALFYGSDNPTLSGVTKKVLCSKTDTKEFLKKKKINVPKGRLFDIKNLDKIKEYSKSIKGHIVLKPNNTDYGINVYCKVKIDDMDDILKKIKLKHKKVLVEEFIEGNEYRIFATKNSDFAVVHRRSASVLGDGKKKIKELVEIKNKGRQSKNEKPRILPWYRIEIDDNALKCLKEQKLTLDSIPKKNQRVFLRYNSNISCGGDSIDFTDECHDSVKKIAKQVLDSIPGLNYAGIDLITEDITKDITNNYSIIEVNNMPGIVPHHCPYIGKQRNVASALIDLVFPKSS